MTLLGLERLLSPRINDLEEMGTPAVSEAF